MLPNHARPARPDHTKNFKALPDGTLDMESALREISGVDMDAVLRELYESAANGQIPRDVVDDFKERLDRLPRKKEQYERMVEELKRELDSTTDACTEHRELLREKLVLAEDSLSLVKSTLDDVKVTAVLKAEETGLVTEIHDIEALTVKYTEKRLGTLTEGIRRLRSKMEKSKSNDDDELLKMQDDTIKLTTDLIGMKNNEIKKKDETLKVKDLEISVLKEKVKEMEELRELKKQSVDKREV